MSAYTRAPTTAPDTAVLAPPPVAPTPALSNAEEIERLQGEIVQRDEELEQLQRERDDAQEEVAALADTADEAKASSLC
jgi:hypothetical protein